MRILYFYQYFGTSKGGWSTRAYEFARRWVEAGDQVTVITSVYDKSDIRVEGFLSRLDCEGIDVRVINLRLSNKHGIATRLMTFAAYAAVACWYSVTLPADVVLASSGPITVGIPGLVARFVRRRRLVFEVRDLWPEGAIQLGILRNRILIKVARLLEKSCYRASHTVVALSDGQAEWIQARHRIKILEVVPNASDNDLVAALDGELELPPWADGKRLVVYAGTLGLIDDCGQILDMAAEIQRRGEEGVEIAIIGEGKERADLEARACRLGLGHVHFLGQLSKEQVMRWLRVATCALLVVKDVPFLSTASPNKLFDAFAAGIPVVQTTDGWIKTLFERERCGLNVTAGSPRALADAVLEIVRDDSLRRTLAENSLRVGKLFDRGTLAEKMRSILAAAAKR